MQKVSQDTEPARIAVSAPRRPKSTEAERLEVRIQRAVRRATGDKVRELKIDVFESSIVLQGRCATFYCKQLAQHGAMSLCEKRSLDNQIEVW